MAWREIKWGIAAVIVSLLNLPWTSLIRWAKEEIKKPSTTDVI
jgi:hypothetical protein